MEYNYTLIFQHIPKTAGTSLADIITRQYLYKKVYTVTGDKKAAIEKFQSYSSEKRNKYKMIRGHQAIKLIDSAYNPMILTMFRNPVDRVVSLYYFYKLNSNLVNTPLHKLTEKYDIGEFFRQGIDKDWLEFSDGQYKSIEYVLKSGMFGREGNRSLNELKRIVGENFIFGIQERFDESLLLFNSKLNWNHPIYYRKANVTPHERKYPSRLIDTISDRNQKDIELYRFACEEFDKQLKGHAPLFESELVSFQKGNNKYGNYYTKKYQVLRYLKKFIL